MPRLRRHHIKREAGSHIAQMTADSLASLIVFLLAIILILIFRLGDFMWPAGVMEYRNEIAGVLSFLVFFLILLSPVIVEANRHPRHLSGPGRSPYGGE